MPEWAMSPPALGSGRIVISPLSPESLSVAFNAVPTSAAWGVTNQAVYIPFRIAVPILIAQLWLLNGSANGNNFDIGVYDSESNRRISTGSTVQGTVSTLQVVDVADTLILPGLYYAALAMNGTTSTAMTLNVGVTRAQWLGAATQTSAFPLPVTFTLVTTAIGVLPIVGITARAVM